MPGGEEHEEERSEEGSFVLDLGDGIDSLTFEQILEMDDDDERDFSKSIVFGFFEQAEQTFKKMDDALKAKDLKDLSSLGHFLKGSSATLGLTKVKDSCEKIQHYGQGKDEEGTTDVEDDELCLKRIKETLETVKEEYEEVEKVLKKFFAPPQGSG
ncbi:Histidine-containing phosphotransfer, HPT [Glarea lozoyensis ATCC 20868]|uniref:Histidine-containing phosphotransfer, HPT n=2 Tax=Glarea lozoyensis TaxID=101852 RepID=S3CLF5_GLAL2|nr:Histidine-containing phosphotransfer, HPT [Glarea lozoyensis ATCC 20868]EHL00287.1 putative Multistep phosphorelay regulator 1 [Glarea lozoyensis 74030]EPE27297.1 Histidine-containing phosphotransfer, HPT [Glarea lozoyensis ATCC 20868]